MRLDASTPGKAIGAAIAALLLLGIGLWLVPYLVFQGVQHFTGYEVPGGFLSYFWFWVLYVILRSNAIPKVERK